MNAPMAAASSLTEAKEPGWMAWRVMTEKKHSTRLSQEHPVGVKCRVILGLAVSLYHRPGGRSRRGYARAESPPPSRTAHTGVGGRSCPHGRNRRPAVLALGCAGTPARRCPRSAGLVCAAGLARSA